MSNLLAPSGYHKFSYQIIESFIFSSFKGYLYSTLARKMMSFRQSENICALGLELKLAEIRFRSNVYFQASVVDLFQRLL